MNMISLMCDVRHLYVMSKMVCKQYLQLVLQLQIIANWTKYRFSYILNTDSDTF